MDGDAHGIRGALDVFHEDALAARKADAAEHEHQRRHCKFAHGEDGGEHFALLQPEITHDRGRRREQQHDHAIPDRARL